MKNTRSSFLVLIIILIVAFLTIIWVNANADLDKSLNKSVGIVISKQCKTMIRNSFETNCPDIKTLVDLNIDTSNRKITGDFGYIDNLYQRLPSTFKSSAGIYNFNDTFQIFIDPPSDVLNKVKIITIENNLETYVTHDQMKKIDNQRQISKYRYVDERCRNISIGGNTWLQTLADSIEYIRHNCDEKFTNYKTVFTVTDNSTITDISTSQKYKEDKWKESIKESHKESKIGNDNSTNKSVTEDKDPRYVPPVTPPFNYTKYK